MEFFRGAALCLIAVVGAETRENVRVGVSDLPKLKRFRESLVSTSSPSVQPSILSTNSPTTKTPKTPKPVIPLPPPVVPPLIDVDGGRIRSTTLQPSAEPTATSSPSNSPLPQPSSSSDDQPEPTPRPRVTLAPSNSPVTQPSSSSDDQPEPTARPRVTSAPTKIPSSSPVDQPEQWVQIGDDIDGEAPNSRFGFSVAISSNGNVLAVGSIGGSPNLKSHVRVFEYLEGVWIQRGNRINGGAPLDSFGRSIALSDDGTTLGVGSPKHDKGNASGGLRISVGQVRVFSWNGIFWDAKGTVIDGDWPGDEFGCSVALSSDGDVLASGAWSAWSPTVFPLGGNVGRVKVFVWNGRDWAQRGISLDGESKDDGFGVSVSLASDGSVVACGRSGYSVINGSASDRVRIFRWTGVSWNQLGQGINGHSLTDWFGSSVSLSSDGSAVAIGAYIGNYCSVFSFGENDWQQVGESIHGEAGGDVFGGVVAISSSGDTLVVAGQRNDGNGPNSGHARVFRLTPDRVWAQVGTDLEGESAYDGFVQSVAVSGDASRIAIGKDRDVGNDVEIGQVEVFQLV